MALVIDVNGLLKGFQDRARPLGVNAAKS